MRLYAYANAAYEQARIVKKRATVYTLGIFQPMENMPDEGLNIAEFFETTAEDLASPGCFYEVDDPEYLEEMFESIAKSVADIKNTPITFYSGLADEGKRECSMSIPWGWTIFNKSSEFYDNRLAMAALTIAGATEYEHGDNRGDVYAERAMKSLGFTNCDSKYYEVDFWSGFCIFADSVKDAATDSFLDVTSACPAVSFGHKTVDIGGYTRHIFAVAIRGTKDLRDVDLDFDSIEEGFNLPANGIKRDLESYIEHKCGISLEDVKDGEEGEYLFYITGHSLGGAVANVLANNLGEYAHDNDVYAYTFATPRTKYPPDEESGAGTFNVLSDEDIVPMYLSTRTQRFGEDIWWARQDFEHSMLNTRFMMLTGGKSLNEIMMSLYYIDVMSFTEKMFIYSHAPETYMSYLLSRADAGETWTYKIRMASVHCPVDVDVYTSTGLLVGRVVNNVVDRDATTGVYIHVEGDEKYIYMPYEGEYVFKLKGTAMGTMDFKISELDPDSSDFENVYARKKVALTAGKQMETTVSSDTNAESAVLYVLDNSGKRVSVVQENGTETPLAAPASTPVPAKTATQKPSSAPAAKKTVILNKKKVTAKVVKAAVQKETTTVILGAKVKKVAKAAFKGTSVKKLVIKTKGLAKKKNMRGCLAKSKVKSVQIKVGSKKANAKYAKKYRKLFGKKSISGKKAKVK